MQVLAQYIWTLAVLLLFSASSAAPMPGAALPGGKTVADVWSQTPSGFFFPQTFDNLNPPSTSSDFSDSMIVAAAPIFGDPFFSPSYSLISDVTTSPDKWNFTEPITIAQIKKVTGITPSDAWIRAHLVPKK